MTRSTLIPPDPSSPGATAIPAWSAFAVFIFAIGLGYAASGMALSLVAGLREGIAAAGSTEALVRAGATLGGIMAAVTATALTEILVVLLALQSFRARAGRALRLGPSHAGAGVLAAAALAMLLLSHGVDTLLQLAGLGDYGTLALLKDVFKEAAIPKLLAAMLVVGLLAGTAEELLFRGFIQSRLTARWGPAAGVLVTSLCFGLAHFDPVHGPAAVFLGLFLGMITEWSGSIRPAIVCHVVNNLFGTLTPAVADSIGGPGVYPATLVVAFGGLFMLLPWLKRRLREGKTFSIDR